MPRSQPPRKSRPRPAQAATQAPAPADPLERLVEVVEARLVPALERIARALEAGAVPAAAVGVGTQVRLALAEERWHEAQLLLEAADPAELGTADQVERLRRDLETGKQRESGRLRERLEASRKVNDADNVLTLYDQLHHLLPLPDRGPLERDVVQWFLGLIMKRMRTGTVRSDVVALAEMVSERFGHTMEGASLRASLPVLRRSSDLCPRCGRPYAGLDDACAVCVGEVAEEVAVEADAAVQADDPPT